MPPRTSGGRYSQEQLEELRYALDQAAIVAITDQRGLITHVNDKFCEISGYSREELIGQDHRLVNSAYHPPAFIRTLWRTIAHGQVWRGEIRNRTKNGEYYWVDTTIVPFVDEHGKPRQYLAIRYDITARKAAEAKLREQTALAQLGQLAAVVAHEVRNPLAGIRGSLQVIEGGLPREAGERPVIASIIRRIDQLSRSMEHLLLYARPQRPMLRPVPVSAVLAEVVMSTRAALGSDCPDIRGVWRRDLGRQPIPTCCAPCSSTCCSTPVRPADRARWTFTPDAWTAAARFASSTGDRACRRPSASACSSRSSHRVPEARGSGLRSSDASRTRRAAPSS